MTRGLDALDIVKMVMNTRDKTLTIEDSEGTFVFKLVEGDENQLGELAGVTLTSIPHLTEGEDYKVFIDGRYCPPASG